MRVAAPYAVLNPKERLGCWNDCVVLLCGVYIRFLNSMFQEHVVRFWALANLTMLTSARWQPAYDGLASVGTWTWKTSA